MKLAVQKIIEGVKIYTEYLIFLKTAFIRLATNNLDIRLYFDFRSKMRFSFKNSIFDQKFDFRTNIRFSNKNSIFEPIFDLR